MTDQPSAAPSRLPKMTAIEQQACAILDKDLDGDEGTIPYVYLDNLGFQTIARGILVDRRKGGKLLPREIAFINQNRIGLVLAGAQPEPWYPAVANDAVRLAAILNMQFQLGAGSDEQFITSFGCIGRKDWAGAARNLRASLWAKQTPARAARVISMIETGKHP